MDSEWSTIPYSSTSYYNISYDIIRYDVEHDKIIYRNEKNSNIISFTYYYFQSNGINPIKDFQWGNVYNGNGIGSQLIINSYNDNLNFRGKYQYNLIFTNSAYQQNFIFEDNSYQENIILENRSYQQNLILENNSLQTRFCFTNGSYQNNLTFTNGYQQNINLENVSYQQNLIFENSAYQSFINLADSSYQFGINLNYSYQAYLNFENNSFQEQIKFDNGGLGYINQNYQSKISLKNESNQGNLTFINDANQQYLRFDNKSNQRNFSSGTFDQSNIEFENYQLDRGDIPLSSSESNRKYQGNLPTINNVDAIYSKKDNQINEISINDLKSLLNITGITSGGNSYSGLTVTGDVSGITTNNYLTLDLINITTGQTVGSSTQIPIITYDNKGRIVSAYTETISSSGSFSGITSINNLTDSVQYIITGNTGNDFNINSSGGIHIINIPTAYSSVTRGLISSIDWVDFKNKISYSGLTIIGDITGQTLNNVLNLSLINITSGNTYNNISFNNKGLVISGYNVSYIESSFTENTYYKLTNPNNYISGITYNNVINALGYTPLSSSTNNSVSYSGLTVTGDVTGFTSNNYLTLSLINITSGNTYNNISYNNKGLVISGYNLNYIQSSFTESNYYKLTNPNNYISGITLIGDITGSGGSLITTTLISITTGQTIGSSTQIPVITYDNKGRITSAYTITTTSGGITNFIAGSLSPLFITNVYSSTTTPFLNFTLSSQTINTVFAAPTGGTGTPIFRNLVSGDIPSLNYLPINNPAYTGTLTTGTLGYSDTGILASLQSNTNSYNQIIIRNTNSGNTASTNFIVSNDVGTATTNFGEVGMNSSLFAGSGFSTAGAVYLAATSAQLFMGTTTNNNVSILANNNTYQTINATNGITDFYTNGNNGYSYRFNYANYTVPTSTTEFIRTIIGTTTTLLGGTEVDPITITNYYGAKFEVENNALNPYLTIQNTWAGWFNGSVKITGLAQISGNTTIGGSMYVGSNSTPTALITVASGGSNPAIKLTTQTTIAATSGAIWYESSSDFAFGGNILAKRGVAAKYGTLDNFGVSFISNSSNTAANYDTSSRWYFGGTTSPNAAYATFKGSSAAIATLQLETMSVAYTGATIGSIYQDGTNVVLANNGLQSLGSIFDISVNNTVGSGSATFTLNQNQANGLTFVDTATSNYLRFITTTGSQSCQFLSNLIIAGQQNKVNLISGNTTIDSTYYIVKVDASGGAITITLPTAVGNNQTYIIIKVDSSINVVTIATTSSQTINGVSTKSLTTQWQSLKTTSDTLNYISY